MPLGLLLNIKNFYFFWPRTMRWAATAGRQGPLLNRVPALVGPEPNLTQSGNPRRFFTWVGVIGP